jgi:hypothetical protein
VRRQVKIEGRQHPTGQDPCALRVCAGGVEPNTRRGSEHHYGMSGIGTVDDRDPPARPVERSRVCDRDESGVAFRQPLPEEPERLGIGGGFRYSRAKQLAKAVPELVGERLARIVDPLTRPTGDVSLRCASVTECRLSWRSADGGR